MTQTPSPDPTSQHSPQSSPSGPKRRGWRRVILVLGMAIALGSGFGYWRLRAYVYAQLVPQVEQTLLAMLERPLEMGAVEGFSPIGIRFGETTLPATATDPDWGQVKAIQVHFNLLEILARRQLSLAVTLINPAMFIEQAESGDWFNLQINQLEPGAIKINLNHINLKNGTVTLFPLEGPISDSSIDGSIDGSSAVSASTIPASSLAAVTLQGVRGDIQLRDDNRRIQVDIKSQLQAGGTVHLDGIADLDGAPLFKGTLKTKRLPIADLMPLAVSYMPQQVGRITDGLLTSQVRIRYATRTPSAIDLNPDLTLWGEATVWDVVGQLPQLPRPIAIERGQLLFRGEQINLKGFRGRYGDIRAIATGRIHLQDGYNLVGNVPATTIAEILDTTGLALPLETKGTVQAKFKVTGDLNYPALTGIVNNKRAIHVDQLRLDTARARVQATLDAFEINTIEAIPTVGGQITGSGTLALSDRPHLSPHLNLNIAARDMPGDKILRRVLSKRVEPYPTFVNPATGASVEIGTVNADIAITGGLNRLQAIAQFQAPEATLPTQGEVVVADRVLRFNDVQTQLSGGHTTTNARVDLAQKQWQSTVQLDQLALSQFPLNQLPLERLPLDAIPPNPLISTDGLNHRPGILNGTIKTAGSLTDLTPEAITLEAQLQLSEAPLFNAPLSTAFRWTGDQLQIANLQIANLQIDPLQPDGQTPQLSARGNVDVRFEGWNPTVRFFDLGVQLRQLQLEAWDIPLPESFYVAGQTDFDGRIFGTLAQPTVDGEVAFTGLTLNQIQFEPLAGPVRFRGDRGVAFDLRGDRDRIAATLGPTWRPVAFDITHSLTATTLTRFHGAIDPTSGGDRLNAQVEEFPLAALNLNSSDPFELGAVDGVVNSSMVVNLAEWDWRHPNPLDTLNIMGEVAIAQPRLGYLAAECFRGGFQLADGVADIQNGQLRFKRYPPLDPLDTPLSPPALQSCDQPTATNLMQPSDLSEQICRDALAANEGCYVFNGSIVAAPTPTFKGEITVEQGHIQEWLQTLQFFDLQDLGRGLKPIQWDSAEDIAGFPLPFATGPDAGIPFSNTDLIRQLQRYAEIMALRQQQKQKRDQAFSLPQLQDLDGTFSGEIDVALSPAAGLTAEFDVSGDNWRWGPYDTPNKFTAQGEFTNGLFTFFPLRFDSGDSWLNFTGSVGWGDDATGQFQATNISAAWVKDFLSLPLEIEGNLNASAAISGSLDNPQARGDIRLVDATLGQKPIQSATAEFFYSNARLGILGDMQLQNNSAHNADPADSDFDSDFDPDAVEPPHLITLSGSLPYRFPQATVAPERDDIEIQIALQDEGIALLNLLNDHFSWEEGTGTVTLDVGGTLRQTGNRFDFRPTITGTALIDSATFLAQVLPAPLTDVTGDVRFDGDRITVNTFDGRFSDGNFHASGIIPLLDPFTPEELAELAASASEDHLVNPPDTPINPPDTPNRQQLLSLVLNDLAVNFKGLYNGGVDGLIDVRGTALAPQIGGSITLSDGRISLPDPTASAVAPPPTADNEEDGWGGLISTPELTDLNVILGQDLLITRLPILNFVATGELNVNGPLQTDMRAIAPEGQITLHSGQVNVFTTQFNLDRSHENTATFKPASGSDPILDVQLETSVLEENRRLLPSDTTVSRSEIAETAIGDFSQLQTIRIQAAVNGPASQLFDSIELSSSPSRSETEIVALIGGGFVDTLGRSEGLIGIANLAGTALFTSLQTLLSNAIGFSDFRVFPTVITSSDREEGGGDIRSTATLALAAELGLRLTTDLSVSALQLLTIEEPTQYNLRYQLNDELLLRGSTNFSDDSRIILEYETRF